MMIGYIFGLIKTRTLSSKKKIEQKNAIYPFWKEKEISSGCDQ
jgi:hypothetical protein